MRSILKFKKVFALGALLVVVGLLATACDFDGSSYVRFTWEASQQHNIEKFYVTVKEVDDWFDDIYYYLDVEEYTVSPKYDGNPKLKSIKAPFDASNPNKGKYFLTEPGDFTAVCEVYDPLYYDYTFIVANYHIYRDIFEGNDRFFEVAFDVRKYLADNSITGGKFDIENDSKRDPPYLTKEGRKYGVINVTTEQVKSGDATMDVTYTVIRRPKK